MIVRDAAGIAIDVPTTRRDAILNESLASHQSILRTTNCYSLISHQIGAESFTLCLQMMPLTPMIMHWTRSASENMCKPMFHDRKVLRERGRSMRIQARKLTIGDKG